jgi:hypothetical protein
MTDQFVEAVPTGLLWNLKAKGGQRCAKVLSVPLLRCGELDCLDQVVPESSINWENACTTMSVTGMFAITSLSLDVQRASGDRAFAALSPHPAVS